MCSLDQASQREHLAAGQANTLQGHTVSPLLISIALDFYSSPSATDRWRLSTMSNDSAQRECLDRLEHAGLINRIGGEYIANLEPLSMYVRALLSTRFPQQRWVMP